MLDILNKYPKAADVIREWFTEVMIASLNTDTIPEDFKEMVRANKFDNEKISNILKYQPRSLFDVFDDNEIVIETLVYPNGEFTIKIGQEGTTNTWKTRKEAEHFAIEAAFQILEQTLSENEVTE
jgi:hypothetical protein